MSPSLTAKPANSIVASLGIGTQALSNVIRMKTPQTPTASTKSTARLTSGSVMEAVSELMAACMQKRLAEPPEDGPPPCDGLYPFPHEPPECAGRPASRLPARGGRAAGGARVLPRLRDPLHRRARVHPRSLRRDAHRLDRLRRDRQDRRVQPDGPPPEV